MNILTLEHITKSYGERKLFDDAFFYLQEGEKVGIIGINGTGKSTLLRMLAGEEEPDEGKRTCMNHMVIRFLSQQPLFHPEETVLESVLAAGNGPGMGKEAEGDAGREGTDGEGGRWVSRSDARAMLTRLGVNDFDQKCGTLSGGQRKRLALVAALLAPADVLILDEPTNHLDNQMSDWLEDYLKKWRGTLVMVTHDRYFLDSVAGRIVEIDHGSLYSCPGNYEAYLRARAERMEREDAGERKRQSILRTELAWMQRGARARSTKQKARIQRYEELQSRQAPLRDGGVELGTLSARMGKTTVELSHISKAYDGKKLIVDFSYTFLKRDRVGFIGPNGCGKTTLMRILTGQLAPDGGEVLKGQTIRIGYYAQELGGFGAQGMAAMDPEKRVLDYIRDVAEYVRTAEGTVSASRMLERFLFFGEEQYGLVGKLSGGEKRRLNLLRVLMEAPNVLVLDEPTNDLDVTTLSILEDYLDDFDGIVITVSHDRYFLDRIVQRIFAFEGEGRLRQYEGGYTDYILRREMEAETQKEAAGGKENGGVSGERRRKENPEGREEIPGEAASGSTGRGKPREMKTRRLKFTWQEQKDYETIEAEIAGLEERIAGLEEQIAQAARDFARLNALMQEKEAMEKTLEERMERWMYLEDLAARIEAEKE